MRHEPTAAMVEARLEALRQALERAEHRAQAAEQREATAQQTISHLLARPQPPKAHQLRTRPAPRITMNFPERP